MTPIILKIARKINLNTEINIPIIVRWRIIKNRKQPLNT